MFESYLLTHLWLPALLWTILYTGDYYLTIWGARLYKSQKHIQVEGSYELTPQYQKDIDSLRMFSPRFVIWLFYGIGILLVVWYTVGDLRHLYGAVVGALLIPEVAVHIRHVQNIVLYRRLCSPNPGVTGSITYSRSYSYSISALGFLCMAIFLLVAFLLTQSWILLGGFVSLLAHTEKHYRYARRLASAQPVQAEANQEQKSD